MISTAEVIDLVRRLRVRMKEHAQHSTHGTKREVNDYSRRVDALIAQYEAEQRQSLFPDAADEVPT